MSSQTSPDWQEPGVSARVYLLAVFAVLAFVGGLFVAEPLIFVSVPLFLLLVFTTIRARTSLPNIEVERSTERVRVRVGQTTRVRLRVRNLGHRPVAMLRIRDSVHAELIGQSTRSAFTSSLLPGETKDFFYELRPRSFGVHGLGPIVLMVQDSTGFFSRHGELSSYTKLAVFPETDEKLGHLAIRPRRTKAWPGEIAARKAGAGMDYYNIRSLTPGDSVKRINWRASARRSEGYDEFLVNEYVAEVGAEVLIIADAGRATAYRTGYDLPAVQTVRAAMSVAERLLRDRNRVGLLTTGLSPRRIPVGYGRRQFDRVALALLELEPGDSDVQWWVDCSIHMFYPNISQVFFVSSLTDANSRDAAAALTRGGQRDVIVVSPNPIAAARADDKRKDRRERQVATKMAQMERWIELDRLRSANAMVVDWATSSSLEEVMEVHKTALSKYAALSARHR
ncbi:MAG: DUF58 domain-containing protein [Nitrososphaerota archaeon]|nr:DUF58 domain-containing protein [Nitrososphaerota archaeon]